MMIDFKKYTNTLVKYLLSTTSEENERICELLAFSPDVETYRIFIEEYLCFKIAMAYQILTDTDILLYNDSVHTVRELANSLINEAVSVINDEITQIPDFFMKPEATEDHDVQTESLSRESIIKNKLWDRWEMYVRGRGLSPYHLFSSKLPASMKDKIDDDKLFHLIYEAYHLVADRIGTVSSLRTVKREDTIIRQFFPNIGKLVEFSIAFIVYFIIPIIIVKWFNSSSPESAREISGIICSVCSGVYLSRYDKKLSSKMGNSEDDMQWIWDAMLISFLVVIGILIVK